MTGSDDDVVEPGQQVLRRRAVLGGVIGFTVTFVIITVAAVALGVDAGLAVLLGVGIGFFGGAGLGLLIGVGREPERARVGPEVPHGEA